MQACPWIAIARKMCDTRGCRAQFHHGRSKTHMWISGVIMLFAGQNRGEYFGLYHIANQH